MKILIVNQKDCSSGGGQEVLVHSLCEGLSSRHEVTLVTSASKIGIGCFYDVIHIHNPLQPFALWCLLRCHGKRVIVSFHSRRYSPFFIRRTLLRLWRRLCLCIIPFFSDIMTYNCEDDRQFFEKDMYIARLLAVSRRRKRGYVVGGGVDGSFFSSSRDFLHSPPRILFVGKTISKGLKEIHALQQRMSDVSFNIIMGGCDRDAMKRHYENADIFLQPSYSECYPTPALVEAMASGLPCVVSDYGGIREVIDNGVHGYIVRIGDVDEYEKAIRRCVRDRTLYARMSREVIHRARERYTMTEYVRRIENLYYA